MHPANNLNCKHAYTRDAAALTGESLSVRENLSSRRTPLLDNLRINDILGKLVNQLLRHSYV